MNIAPKDLQSTLHEGNVDSDLGYFSYIDAPDIYQQRLLFHDPVCRVGYHHRATAESRRILHAGTRTSVRWQRKSADVLKLFAEQGIEHKIVL